jgi:hypothetical protein
MRHDLDDSSIEDRLAPGEVVLWRGKPVWKAFVFRTWPLTIFGAVLVVAVLWYEGLVFTTELADIMAFVGLPFIFIALYMAIGHFLVTAREWRNTEYLVSERQVLIQHGIFRPSVAMYSLLGMPHTLLEMHGEGVGNIMFKPPEGEGYGPQPGYQTMWPYTPDYVLGFLYIEQPDKVQQIIEKARLGGRR